MCTLWGTDTFLFLYMPMRGGATVSLTAAQSFYYAIHHFQRETKADARSGGSEEVVE